MTDNSDTRIQRLGYRKPADVAEPDQLVLVEYVSGGRVAICGRSSVRTMSNGGSASTSGPSHCCHVFQYHLPITKDWIRQFALCLVLIGHSSFRAVYRLEATRGLPIEIFEPRSTLAQPLSYEERKSLV